MPFDFWLNEVKVWQAVTNLTVKKKGPAVALSLQRRRRDVALEIPIAQLGADDGLDQLLVKLKDVFGKETVDQQYEAYELFESMRRSSDGVVPQYIQDFERNYDSIKRHGMELTDSVLACKLLHGACLELSERRIVLANANKLKYLQMKAALRRIIGVNWSASSDVLRVTNDESAFAATADDEEDGAAFSTKRKQYQKLAHNKAKKPRFEAKTEKTQQEKLNKKRQIANPWTVGYEEELKSLHTEISTEVMRRNELINQTLGESHGMLADALTASRGRLVAARKKMKKRLRQLERLWWDEIIIECENAAEKGDMGTMYKTLRKLGTRSQKHQTGTTISTDEFKAHFSNVSKDRYENDPGTLMNTVKQMPDKSKDVKFITANQKLNTLPSEKEIMEALDEVRESAPGKDGVRMVYIRNAYWKWREKVIHLVMRMFTTRADLWEESLKKGQIVPLHKKREHQ